MSGLNRKNTSISNICIAMVFIQNYIYLPPKSNFCLAFGTVPGLSFSCVPGFSCADALPISEREVLFLTISTCTETTKKIRRGVWEPPRSPARSRAKAWWGDQGAKPPEAPANKQFYGLKTLHFQVKFTFLNCYCSCCVKRRNDICTSIIFLNSKWGNLW